MKRLILLLALGTMPLLVVGQVSAANDATLQQEITPLSCGIDVVQDIDGQTVRITTPDCEELTDDLIVTANTDPLDPTIPLIALTTSEEFAVGRRPQGDPSQVWVPLVKVSDVQRSIPTVLTASVMAGGVAAATVATAVGIDMAVFGMHYSKTTMNWTKRQVGNKVLRRNRTV